LFPRPPGHTEERAYFEKASLVLRDVARLILETGMRPEEVYTIRPENLDLARKTLQVPHGKTKAARRLLNLTAGALEVLKRRMAGLETPYLFPCETDPTRPIPKVNNAHDRAVKDSKIAPFRLYDLRHTWATRAAMSGIDLVTLAAMLGHSRIQMVLRYAHPTQAHQAKAMEQLEKYNAAQQIAAFEKQQPAMTSDAVRAQEGEMRVVPTKVPTAAKSKSWVFGSKLLKGLEARVGIEPTHCLIQGYGIG
jgi:integrase